MASQNADYIWIVDWCIEGLLVHPNLEGDIIKSRPFTLAGLANTRWRLELHIENETEEGQEVSVHLRRLPPDNADWWLCPNEVVVDICIRFEYEEQLYASGKHFKVFDSDGIDSVLKNYSKHGGREWQQFTLCCDISPSIESIPGYHNDFIKLSNDMRELFVNQEYFDVILNCQGSEFKVHRNILAFRSKLFMEQLGIDFNVQDAAVRINVVNIPLNILRTILIFIYAGTLDIPLFKVTQQLFNAVSYYGLIDLKRKLQTFPSHMQIRNRVTYERKHLRWILAKGDGVSVRRYVRKMTVEILYCDEVIITCQTTRNFLHGPELCCQFSFEIIGFNADIPIYFNCKLTCKDTKLQKFFSENFFTSNEKKFKWDFTLKSPEPLQQLEILSEVVMSDGAVVFVPHCNWLELRDSHISDFEKLSVDFLRMFEAELLEDVRIRCESVEFKVHRSILCARAANFAEFVFAQMQRNENGIAEMNNTSANTMRSLLTYLYRGTLTGRNYLNWVGLNVLAKKHSILHLETKCHLHMMRILRDEYISNLLRV